VKLAGDDEKHLTKHSTENTEAYQLYLKGRFYWNKRKADDLQKAVEYFDQAIEKDPGYALAYAGLASTYAVLPEYSGLPARDFIPKAEIAARKALDYDATMAEPHAVLGLIRYSHQWDWTGGEQEFKQAMDRNPNYPTSHHWYGICLRQQGKFEAALSESKRALELDPLSLVINWSVGELLSNMQRYDLAMEQFKKTVELDPNFPGTYQGLGITYAQQGRFAEAIGELQKAKKIVGANNPYASGLLGHMYARAGRKDEATQILNQLLDFSQRGYELSVQIAGVYAGLGEKDKAFEWLEKGYTEQNSELGWFKIAPEWSNLRSDPRYAVMLKKIGLDK
jgi:tetratricopeptide (TPR) repeat protein